MLDFDRTSGGQNHSLKNTVSEQKAKKATNNYRIKPSVINNKKNNIYGTSLK